MLFVNKCCLYVWASLTQIIGGPHRTKLRQGTGVPITRKWCSSSVWCATQCAPRRESCPYSFFPIWITFFSFASFRRPRRSYVTWRLSWWINYKPRARSRAKRADLSCVCSFARLIGRVTHVISLDSWFSGLWEELPVDPRSRVRYVRGMDSNVHPTRCVWLIVGRLCSLTAFKLSISWIRPHRIRTTCARRRISNLSLLSRR